MEAQRFYLKTNPEGKLEDLPILPANRTVQITVLPLNGNGSNDLDDWTDEEWQQFALGQFNRDADQEEVYYSLDDLQEIYDQ